MRIQELQRNQEVYFKEKVGMEHAILNLKRQIECPQDYDEMKNKIAELSKIVAQQQRWMDLNEDQQR